MRANVEVPPTSKGPSKSSPQTELNSIWEQKVKMHISRDDKNRKRCSYERVHWISGKAEKAQARIYQLTVSCVPYQKLDTTYKT